MKLAEYCEYLRARIAIVQQQKCTSGVGRAHKRGVLLGLQQALQAAEQIVAEGPSERKVKHGLPVGALSEA